MAAKKSNRRGQSYEAVDGEDLKKKTVFSFRNLSVIVSMVVIGTSYLLSGYRNELSVGRSKSPSSKVYDVVSGNMNVSANHDGILILGAPQSGLYYLSSFLSSAGFRITTKAEPEDAILLKYTPNNRTAKVREDYPNMEPFERVDALHENKELLRKQKFRWDSQHIYKFDNEIGQAGIKEDGFLDSSHMLDFLDGIDKEDEQPWLWQDPQMCILFPAWLDAVSEVRPDDDSNNETTTRRNVAAVLSYQHPLAMAKLLHARNHSVTLVQGMQLWLDYNFKCFSNIHETGLCTIFTTLDKLRDNPSREVNRIIRRVNNRCGLAPGTPGELLDSDAKGLLHNLKRYEKRMAVIFENTFGSDENDEWHNQIITEALGVWSPQEMDCEQVLQRHSLSELEQQDLHEEQSAFDYGSPMLANAINELVHLEEAGQNTDEQRTKFREARNDIFRKLTQELRLWVGEKYADSIESLVHQELNDTTSLNKEPLKQARIEIMTRVKTEIRMTMGDALSVYCSLESGDALTKEYKWPQQLRAYHNDTSYLNDTLSP